MSEVKEVMVEPGIYKRANRYITRVNGKYIASTASLASARMERKNARLQLVRTKSNTARDKKTKTKKDVTVHNLHESRKDLLKRNW